MPSSCFFGRLSLIRCSASGVARLAPSPLQIHTNNDLAALLTNFVDKQAISQRDAPLAAFMSSMVVALGMGGIFHMRDDPAPSGNGGSDTSIIGPDMKSVLSRDAAAEFYENFLVLRFLSSASCGGSKAVGVAALEAIVEGFLKAEEGERYLRGNLSSTACRFCFCAWSIGVGLCVCMLRSAIGLNQLLSCLSKEFFFVHFSVPIFLSTPCQDAQVARCLGCRHHIRTSSQPSRWPKAAPTPRLSRWPSHRRLRPCQTRLAM